MSVPGNKEPGALSGQQQSINFSSAIPIKKRRFPMFRPASPTPEEKPSGCEDNSSKNKQESSIPVEGLSSIAARNMDSPGNSDVSKTSALLVKKELVTPTSIESAQTNVEIFASKHQESKPSVSLGPIDDLRNKVDILPSEKYAEPQVSGSSMGAHTMKVKQEIASGQTEGTCGLELSKGTMNVELSLGPKEPLVPALEHQNSEAIFHKIEKSDPSLLSLALSEEKLVLHDTNDGTPGNVSSRVCDNRSNWDLNTTMDVWEGSTNNDFGRLSKTNNSDDVKSSLTTAGVVGLSIDKGKHILGYHRSNSSNAPVRQSQQYKTDDSLGLRLAMPYRELDASGERSALPNKAVSSIVSPNLNFQQVQLLAMNVSRSVKSEPIDEKSKRDCSIGSSSSSTVGLSKLTSVKRELVDNQSLETVLPSSIRSEKLVDRNSIKSEVVQEGNQESYKSEDAVLPKSVSRVMQHQESCASSSALAVPLMPQNPCLSRLSTCSELTSSGDLSNQSEHSFHSKELHDNNGIRDEPIVAMVSKPVSLDTKQLRLGNVGNLNVEDADKCDISRVDEDTLELCQYGEVAANDEEKINISAEMLEEDPYGSDCESHENHVVDMDIEEDMSDKEDEEYEDGEVREPQQHPAVEESIVEGEKTESLELVERGSRNLQPSVLLGDQSNNISDFDGRAAVTEDRDGTSSDPIKERVTIGYEPNTEDNSLQKLSDKVLEVEVDEKRPISVTPEKQPDLSGRKDVEEGTGKEVSCDGPTKSHGIGIELGDEATEKVVKEICSEKNDSTSSKVEASLDGHDAAKDSNNAGNKSRIITLPRASAVTTPCKTRSIPNRLLASRSGKERYSNLDGEMQPRGNRDEVYTGGSNKFAKDRVHDQSLRNSRPSFMRGKGRVSGRFGSLRNEWDSDHDFASETYNDSSGYRVVRRKHTSTISDVELERNGYGIAPDGTALGSNRRKTMNDEFHPLRRTSLRRLSPGDRDGPVTRGGMQMLRRIPRNFSPSRCAVEDGSDLVGLRHGDKFMRHLPDDIIDPVYTRQQAMYDELDGQLVRGNRNFSNMHRKGYPQIRSKSPVRSRSRSPGPWSSPRRRSPNGLPELTQHRSPAMYRMGRMRSPDRACFHDEMVARRRGSPSYVARNPNDLRDVDSGQEHVHPRSGNSNRRSSPARVFQRSARRADALDSREMGDSDDYINGPLHSNKFHELRGDGGIDERRKFIERRGPLRSFRPSYSGDGDNFRFHLNDGPRPYRFCPDADTEFVERSNMREREFDGRIKHQPLVVPRRNRNTEEQQDGNYRPVERVWHDDGFTDVSRVKRRRF